MKKLLLLFLLLLPVVSAQCEDTDNGLDYYIKGNATFTDEADVVAIKYIDKCLDKGQEVYSCSGGKCVVEETYCDQDAPAKKEYSCSDGCRNGVCLEHLVILTSAASGPKSDDKILLDAMQYLKVRGYEIDFADVKYFNDVNPKFTNKAILAVKYGRAAILVKKSASDTIEDIGEHMENFLKQEEIDYVRQSFISTNSLHDIFTFCNRDGDCNDFVDTTKDTCEGDPKVCVYTEIDSCVTGDGFCPGSCEYPEDEDCNECSSKDDCSDELNSTQDICSGKPLRCKHIEITECRPGDGYCPDNCDGNNDPDCKECLEDSECADGSACTADTCNNFLCTHDQMGGCDFNGNCVQIGTIAAKQYCSKKLEMTPQARTNDACEEDYECRTDFCSDQKCKNPSAWNKFMSWLSGLFT